MPHHVIVPLCIGVGMCAMIFGIIVGMCIMVPAKLPKPHPLDKPDQKIGDTREVFLREIDGDLWLRTATKTEFGWVAVRDVTSISKEVLYVQLLPNGKIYSDHKFLSWLPK